MKTNNLSDARKQEFEKLLSDYPLSEEHRTFLYGTSGYRYEASKLAPVALRMGIMAALISLHREGRAVGVMVTASHNPHTDNGLKILDSCGNYLESRWEPLANALIQHSNAAASSSSLDGEATAATNYAPSNSAQTPSGTASNRSGDDAESVYQLVCEQISAARSNSIGCARSPSCCVLIGEDTRISSPTLSLLVKNGAELIGGGASANAIHVLNVGRVTTPQFQSVVACYNQSAQMNTPSSQMIRNIDFSQKTEQSSSSSSCDLDQLYFDDFARTFLKLLINNGREMRERTILFVDCANGVGAITSARIKEKLRNQILNMMESLTNNQNNLTTLNDLQCLERAKQFVEEGIQLRNTNIERGDLVNQSCGAEHLKTTKLAPIIWTANQRSNANMRDCIDEQLHTLKEENGFKQQSGGDAQRWASLDGDADRLMFFYAHSPLLHLNYSQNSPLKNINNSNKSIQLDVIEGDHLAVLVISYLQRLLTLARVDFYSFPEPACSTHSPLKNEPNQSAIQICAILTAYSNSACRRFIEQKLGLRVHIIPIGTKYAARAQSHIDIRVYFDSNGHGAIMFSPRAKHILLNLLDDIDQKQTSNSAKEINEKEQFEETVFAARRELVDCISFFDKIHPSDSIGLLFFVEFMLYRSAVWSMQIPCGSSTESGVPLLPAPPLFHELPRAFYSVIPSVQKKVSISDRTLLVTTTDEQRVIKPTKLQCEIDRLVAEIQFQRKEEKEMTRLLVRCSGTENVVRIYAEAPTLTLANELAESASKLIPKYL